MGHIPEFSRFTATTCALLLTLWILMTVIKPSMLQQYGFGLKTTVQTGRQRDFLI